MKTYSVQMPVTGSILVTVEAESAEAAKAVAWDKIDFRVVASGDCEAGEFEVHDKVAYGNVCAALCNEINVEEV